MNGTKVMLLGIQLNLVGGFVLVSPNSSLPFSLDLVLLFTGLWVGLYGLAMTDDAGLGATVPGFRD